MKTDHQTVAIIGAGAAGIISAREALRLGFQPTIFEQSSEPGGIWVYKDKIDDDPLGQNAEHPVYSSLYEDLRTNLPRDLMGILDYPFTVDLANATDLRRYPGHKEVLNYLQNLVRVDNLEPFIHFNKCVSQIKPLDNGWQIDSIDGQQQSTSQVFDTVMVCNGHYSHPRLAPLAGMENFQGELLHSHNFRRSSDFKNKRVLLYGASASGMDLGIHLSHTAKHVYWCANKFENVAEFDQQFPGISRLPAPVRADNQSVYLNNGRNIDPVDTIIFCTGYHYHLPFLDQIVSVEDNWVHPLYLDIVPPAFPSLALIGIPSLVVPFPLFQTQAAWFLRHRAGLYNLPTEASMQQTIRKHIQVLKESNTPLRHYHRMGEGQISYMNQLRNECGLGDLPDWYTSLAGQSGTARLANPTSFRDVDP